MFGFEGWLTPTGLAMLGYTALLLLSVAFVPLERLREPWRTVYVLLCAPALLIGAVLCYGVALWAWVHTLPWLILSLPVIGLAGWICERLFTPRETRS